MARILAFHCHPDDIELLMGGTMSLLAQAGHEIHFAVMAGGEVGSPILKTQDIREKRLEESRNAAALINASFYYAGGHDLQVEYNDFYRKQAVRVVREVNPEIIITAPPSDYLIDHEETSRLVRNAAFIASVPNFDCGLPTSPTAKAPHLYYCDAAGNLDPFGNPLPLHFGINISTVFETKKQMAACHESQEEWIGYMHGGETFVQIMEKATRKSGERFGVPYAEGFIQHLGMGHPTDPLLQNLLKEHLLEVTSK